VNRVGASIVEGPVTDTCPPAAQRRRRLSAMTTAIRQANEGTPARSNGWAIDQR
jgi:hypothetical protein